MLTYTAFPHDMVGLGGRGTYSRRHNLRHPVPVPEGLDLQPLRQHLLDLRAAIEDVNFFLFPIYRISRNWLLASPYEETKSKCCEL